MSDKNSVADYVVQKQAFLAPDGARYAVGEVVPNLSVAVGEKAEAKGRLVPLAKAMESATNAKARGVNNAQMAKVVTVKRKTLAELVAEKDGANAVRPAENPSDKGAK